MQQNDGRNDRKLGAPEKVKETHEEGKEKGIEGCEIFKVRCAEAATRMRKTIKERKEGERKCSEKINEMRKTQRWVENANT